MALSSASHVVLPYAQCSSGRQTRHCPQSQGSRDLGFRVCTASSSSLRVRESGCRRELSKSITRAVNSDHAAGNENSRARSITRAENAENAAAENKNSRARVSDEASNYEARRTYRKGLASLRVTGEALPVQVTAALAADGGRTAAQELAQGKPMLVIETYNPGRYSEGSSVATKLQAPTLSVLKRAKSIPKTDSRQQQQFSSSSGRAFAIAFQAVRVLNLSKFELCFFEPGTSKGMDDFKDGEVVAFLEVFDASTLDSIAKTVCSYALACVKDHAEDQTANSEGFSWSKLFQYRQQKAKQTTAIESSAVKISTLTEPEVLAHMETIVEEKTLVGASMISRRHKSWWERPLATQAVVTSGVDPQLVDEFIPAHTIEFKLPSTDFETVGLQKTSPSSCKIHLTHAQMMDLADVLDLYCGDPYTGSGEDVSISIDILRRNKWTEVVQAAAVAAFACSLLLGFLLVRRAGLRRSQTQTPPPQGESIFDMAFSQKLRELREGEPVDDEPVGEEQSADVEEKTEAGNEQPVDDDVDIVEVAEKAEPVYNTPTRVSFRGRTRYYN